MIVYSLILPVYNRNDLLVDTLLSLNNTLSKNFEVIVVDDGSQPAVKIDAIKEMYNYPIILLRQENKERGAARNLGVEHANGKYVSFLDSDDRISNNYFLLADEMAAKEVSVFAFRHEVRNQLNNKLLWVSPIVKPNEVIKALMRGNFLSCHSIFIKKEIALKNKFNENRGLSGLEDWELWIRLAIKENFQLRTEITSTLLQHPNRSVVSSSASQIEKKTNLFISIVSENISKYNLARYRNRFFWSAYSYASLHLALIKEKKKALVWLVRGLRYKPFRFFSKRSLVIFKHMLWG